MNEVDEIIELLQIAEPVTVGLHLSECTRWEKILAEEVIRLRQELGQKSPKMPTVTANRLIDK